ncbi:arginine--tRNA ligase [Solirubrobacter ginsenosidimutans]|uniref:Arginine--tRNA ligase n=1 Tax=Solirubrobacter ginsenosidimutans TaxID=490573 RepID=A0A9X3MZF1_9ACTN|nr:arginine--tRNA ligase [Solirubrobacter ginsenosidimutans]
MSRTIISRVHPIDELRAAVEAAAGDLRNGNAAPKARASLERPKKAGFGDYSTNAAMLLAPALGAPPREIAERLGAKLTARLGEAVDHVEVAGPGFLNVFLADAWYVAAARQIVAAGDEWGRGTPEHPEKVIVEFVSANPTGPLTAASGRHAAYGDALARLLELSGNTVTREYYFNNAGSQVDKLGASVRARARHEPVPEDGYQGDYVTEIAARIPGAAEKTAEELGAVASALIMESIRATLAAYRVEFDSYFLEGSVYDGDPSPIAVAFELLKEQGHSYESEGALWMRTTEYGDDKDRVLKRSTGAPTYFAADVAYHENKVQRGYDRLIDVLGADHHGYIGRMKGVMEALGHEPGRLEIPILQFVHVVEGGEKAKMSKRRGDFVTLDELLETIGVDATRWFMISRSHESTIDLDLELAAKQDAENPVYYVQYAHARIASILRNADAAEVEAALVSEGSGLALNASERELIRKLLSFPPEVREATERRAPHRIAGYALELGQAFAAFYRDSPVLKEQDAELRAFRLALCVASQKTLAAALGLLGVSAPEAM